MNWVAGGGVLLTVGVVLRHVLHLDSPAGSSRVLAPLGAKREAIYLPIAQELETEATIIGVSLNDAFEERDSGHDEIAWRLVRLAASEWNRMAEVVAIILNAISKYMPTARVVVPARNMAAHRFRSQAMIDYVRMHEFLDRFVFRSRLRFQLHIRVLRRAVDTLSQEFRHAYRAAERVENRPTEIWQLLDLHFHDFDLLSKETLLAFRSFLMGLPDSELASFSRELKTVTRHGVRSSAMSVDQ